VIFSCNAHQLVMKCTVKEIIYVIHWMEKTCVEFGACVVTLGGYSDSGRNQPHVNEYEPILVVD
jgi:hypothetical protein